MQKLIYNIELDTKIYKPQNDIILKQYDIDSALFIIKIVEADRAYPLSGSSVEIIFTKPDGTYTMKTQLEENSPLIIVQNNIHCLVPQSALTVIGTVNCEVTIRGAEGEKLTTRRFGFYVDSILLTESVVLSGDNVHVLDGLISQVNRLVGDTGDIKEALDESVVNANTINGILANEVTGTIKVATDTGIDLEDSIEGANYVKGLVEGTIDDSETAKTNLEGTIGIAGTTQTNLNNKIGEATTSKQVLDQAIIDNQIVTLPVFNEHKLDYAQQVVRIDKLEDAKIKRYGVRRVLNATTPVMGRLFDAVGLVANADTDLTKHNVVVNNFDTIYPWSHMRHVIIEQGTNKRYYKGEAGYDTAIGDWVVEIPKFLLKHTNDGVNEDFIICALPLTDYKYPDVFYNDDGKLLDYIDVARFETSQVGGISVSRPNNFPQVNAGRQIFRSQALAKANGWQLEDDKARYVLEILYNIEFANLNSQLVLGNGVSSVRYTEDDLVQLAEDNTNRVVLLNTNAGYYAIGETISLGTTRGSFSGFQGRTITAINVVDETKKELVFDGAPANVLITYKVYQVGQIAGKTLGLLSSSGTAIGTNNKSAISYRGIENIFGNVWEWIDGLLINERQVSVCNKVANYGDVLNANFSPIGYVNHNTDGYVGEMGYDKNYPFVKFPINTTGGSTTKYCDYYYQATGLRAPVGGGPFGGGVGDGLFSWFCSRSPSGADFTVGSRLLRKPLV